MFLLQSKAHECENRNHIHRHAEGGNKKGGTQGGTVCHWCPYHSSTVNEIENLQQKQNWTAKSTKLKENTRKVKSVFVIRAALWAEKIGRCLEYCRSWQTMGSWLGKLAVVVKSGGCLTQFWLKRALVTVEIGLFQKISIPNQGRLPCFNPPCLRKFQTALPPMPSELLFTAISYDRKHVSDLSMLVFCFLQSYVHGLFTNYIKSPQR